MSVIVLAFPNIDLLTGSYTSAGSKTEAEILDVANVARSVGLRDRSWHAVEGPRPMVGDAKWLRGDLGGIACIVQRPIGTLLHMMARDGTPLAIVRKTSRSGNG